jgi:hypothetical protein
MKTMFAAAAVLFAAAAPATAGTLYQSLPDLTVDPVVAGYCSSCNAFLPYRIYDTFTLAADSTIRSVTFALDTSFYAGNSVDVGFFNLAAGLPGSSIASYTFTPAQFTSSFDVPTASERSRSLVTVAIPDLMLAAGSYDISFFNAGGLSIPGYAKTGGTLYQSGNFFDPAGFKPNQSAAFSVSGAVPEPASWALMIAGFGLVGAGMRRRVALAA